MKLIIAIIRDIDNERVSHALTSKEFRVTYIASTGGFLRKGQSTLLIGVEDEHLEAALTLIRENVTKPSNADDTKTIFFVVNVEDHMRF